MQAGSWSNIFLRYRGETQKQQKTPYMLPNMSEQNLETIVLSDAQLVTIQGGDGFWQGVCDAVASWVSACLSDGRGSASDQAAGRGLDFNVSDATIAGMWDDGPSGLYDGNCGD